MKIEKSEIVVPVPVPVSVLASSPRIEKAFANEDCFTETDFPNPVRNIGELPKPSLRFSRSFAHPVAKPNQIEDPEENLSKENTKLMERERERLPWSARSDMEGRRVLLPFSETLSGLIWRSWSERSHRKSLPASVNICHVDIYRRRLGFENKLTMVNPKAWLCFLFQVGNVFCFFEKAGKWSSLNEK